MKGKILKYSMEGLLCGSFVYLVFSILLSLRLNTGDFYLVLPALAEDYKSELFATMIQIFVFCWFGGFCGIAYFFSECVEWSFQKQVIGYIFSLTTGMVPLAFVGHWFEHLAIGLFSYLLILLAITFILFVISWFKLKSDVNKIKKEIGIRKNKMRNVQVSSKWIIRWLWVNYGIFVLGFFTLGFFSDNKIVRINFVLDVLICIISLILNFLLFRKRYQITCLGKITLLFLTFCFMAFTYFAFLTSGNGLPPALFM